VFAEELSEASISAANVSMPITCDRKIAGRLPGWSERVQPLRDKSLFWHRMWADSGRPRDGAVADVMRRTRAAYHHAIRQIRQEENAIIHDRIATSLSEDGERNFWQDIKRIRGHEAVSCRMVDGSQMPVILLTCLLLGIVTCTRAYLITLMKCRIFSMVSTAH
jgi:hypothetical protein